MFELVILFLIGHMRGPQEHITYDLVFASPAVSSMSGSSSLYSFRDRWLVAVKLTPCGVLLPGPVQYCSQHSCIIAVELLLQPFSQRPSSAFIQQYRHDRHAQWVECPPMVWETGVQSQVESYQRL